MFNNLNSAYRTVLAALTALILLQGCHSYALDDAQHKLRDSFVEGDFEKSEQLLKKYERKDVYRSKDRVLKNLEAGTVHHFAGNYDSSHVFFEQAELQIEDAYTKSLSRGFASLLNNDNTLAYDGEPYEDLYLNAFKSLNFIHRGNREAALVEARRMAFKMEQMDIKLKGLADAFAREDTTGKVKWESGEMNVQNSAMSHYLAAVLFAKSGKADDARIEAEKLRLALTEQPAGTNGPGNALQHVDTDKIQDAEAYNVLVTAFTGQAPVKKQEDIRLWLGGEDEDDDSFYVKFSLPELRMRPSRVKRIRTVVNDTLYYEVPVVEHMDRVAAEVYKAKRPVIYARGLLRASLKATGSSLVAGAVRDENKGLGLFIDFLGFLAQETTEKADLRGWQTLPGQAWMQVISLPPGTHTLRTEYLDRRGRVLYSKEQTLQTGSGNELHLAESIYSF